MAIVVGAATFTGGQAEGNNPTRVCLVSMHGRQFPKLVERVEA